MASESTMLAPGVFSYFNVMSDPKGFISNIEQLVETKKLIWTPGEVTDERKNPTPTVNPNVRIVDVIGIPPYDRGPTKLGSSEHLVIHLDLNKQILPIIEDYRIQHKMEKRIGENWQILKYGASHHFKEHQDDSKMYPRTFSISYYLNDDYSGGEIEFPRFGLKIKPIANQAVIFPANYVYNHMVHPVTSGYRWAVVNWFE